MRYDVEIKITQIYRFAIEAATAMEAQTNASGQLEGKDPDETKMEMQTDRGKL